MIDRRRWLCSSVRLDSTSLFSSHCVVLFWLCTLHLFSFARSDNIKRLKAKVWQLSVIAWPLPPITGETPLVCPRHTGLSRKLSSTNQKIPVNLILTKRPHCRSNWPYLWDLDCFRSWSIVLCSAMKQPKTGIMWTLILLSVSLSPDRLAKICDGRLCRCETGKGYRDDTEVSRRDPKKLG